VKQPRRPDPAPLRTNDRAAILVGTGLWAIALLVLLIIPLPPEDSWWIWTCVTGIAFGGFGYWFVSRMHRRATGREEQQPLPTRDA